MAGFASAKHWRSRNIHVAVSGVDWPQIRISDWTTVHQETRGLRIRRSAFGFTCTSGDEEICLDFREGRADNIASPRRSMLTLVGPLAEI